MIESKIPTQAGNFAVEWQRDEKFRVRFPIGMESYVVRLDFQEIIALVGALQGVIAAYKLSQKS